LFRALRKLRKEALAAKYMFTSECEATPFAESGFAKMVERAAKKAGADALKVHPHMLRHACGPGQRGPRYPVASGVSAPQEHPAHGEVHEAVARPVQGLWERRAVMTFEKARSELRRLVSECMAARIVLSLREYLIASSSIGTPLTA
jgi:hypothetical protein